MLEHPDHRVADAVDMREERFCDDGNAHTITVTALIVAKVADGHTGREISWSTSYALVGGRCWDAPRRSSRLSNSASPTSVTIATSQATTAMEPAGMIANPELRCCTRTRLGSFLLYSTYIRMPVDESDGYSTPSSGR